MPSYCSMAVNMLSIVLWLDIHIVLCVFVFVLCRVLSCHMLSFLLGWGGVRCTQKFNLIIIIAILFHKLVLALPCLLNGIYVYCYLE